MATKTATHRVICADFTHETTGLSAAQGNLAGVEAGGHCRQPHTMEVRVDGAWVPLHIVRAREILAVDIGAFIDTPDGPLGKVHGGWSKETGDRADAAADAGTDPRAWIAALGTHEHATLTADCRGARSDGWCQCGPRPSAERWIRYERWTAQGRVGHGYVCPTCRFLTQTG